MSYRIAGIDVHKRMLAVVVADVSVEGEYQFERRQYGSGPEQLRALADWLIYSEVQEAVMESTAQYLEAGVANAGATLESGAPEANRCRSDGRNAAFGAGLDESGSAGAQAGFRRRRTSGEATGGAGIEFELCARRRAAPVAEPDAPEAATHVRPGAFAESLGGTARGDPHQAVQPGFGSAGSLRAAHVAGARRRRDRCGGSGGDGPSTLAGHAATVMRRAGSRSRTQLHLPATGGNRGRAGVSLREPIRQSVGQRYHRKR